MKIPPFLKAGDKVGIVSPARKISAEDLQPAIQDLEAWGYEVVPGRSVYAIDHQYAGTDAQRTADLQSMLDDPDIKAILCARGGYGSLRIVDGLNWKGMKKSPKWLIGFSDITTLTMAAYNLGIASIHGPMGISWNGQTGDPASRDHLRDMLAGKVPEFSWGVERPDLTRTGTGTGPIIGGNLSMLSQLLGTETDFSTKGCIFFLEDLDEYLYHVDRMIVHLKRGGKFDRLAGLVIGGFTDLHDNDTPFGMSFEEIILDALPESGFPVCFDAPIGHQPRNYPIPHGVKATLSVSHSTAELKFDL